MNSLHSIRYLFIVWVLTGCGVPDIPQGMRMIAGKEEMESFYIDSTEVTVGQFSIFIEQTGYVTTAEQLGWSGVFDKKQQAWQVVQGANWRFPKGPEEDPAQPDLPVTQVSWMDADAYATWAGKRLPTRKEWELAAHGLVHERYPWGDIAYPDSIPRGNWRQGPFPKEDSGWDGFNGLAPVASFPPNDFGLYDMAGNVWEWTSDFAHRSEDGEPNPSMIIKGGSFLCSATYCEGYATGAIQFTPKDSGSDHIGFRCVF